MRFDPEKVLLDPYGKGVVVPAGYNRQAANEPGDNMCHGDEERRRRPDGVRLGRRRAAAAAVVADDYLRDACPRIYAPPSSGVGEQRRGTYAGLIEKIPYLKNWESPQSSCCPCFNSTPSMHRRANQLLGLFTGLVFCTAPGI